MKKINTKNKSSDHEVLFEIGEQFFYGTEISKWFVQIIPHVREKKIKVWGLAISKVKGQIKGMSL